MVALAACHHGAPRTATAVGTSRATTITLFSDGALVEQAIEIDLRDATPVTLRASLPYDVVPEDVVVIDRGGVALGPVHLQLHADELVAPPQPEAAPEVAPEVATDPVDGTATDTVTPPTPALEVETPVDDPPRIVELVAHGPRGHHVVHLAYQTTAMVFSAAYTVTTTAARDRATLRGVLAISNLTGIALPHAEVALVDTTMADWQARARGDLIAQLGGPGDNATVRVVRRPLGTFDLVSGTTRVELLPDEAPRHMRSVLVYDPFGTSLDSTAKLPNRDPALGAHAPSLVTESFEIARPTATSKGLPAGPVRLLERQRDGAVTVLGESRLFDAATREAQVDTIPVGTAEGITARRERVEVTIDDDLKRIVEEVAIVITNTRPAPIDVVLREHAYRGPTWTLAYHSTPTVQQEGSQQFAMRAHVPANATARTSHVVVYRW